MAHILVLFSGGLDSRLAIKLLKKKGYTLTALFFKLPFASRQPTGLDLLKEEGVNLHILNCARGERLEAYLDMLKKPRFGRGKGYNPCLDCKLFMIDQAADFALQNGHQAIATGEVPGQRPMSQTRKKMNILEKASPLPLIRPLAEKGLQGRTRQGQMKMARHYRISYPLPAGGCLLCEKELKKRHQTLIAHDLINQHTLPLAMVGRHFYLPSSNTWLVVGRNKEENDVIEPFSTALPSDKGRPAVYYHCGLYPERAEQEALQIQKAYQNKDRQGIAYYSRWKLE